MKTTISAFEKFKIPAGLLDVKQLIGGNQCFHTCCGEGAWYGCMVYDLPGNNFDEWAKCYDQTCGDCYDICYPQQ